MFSRSTFKPWFWKMPESTPSHAGRFEATNSLYETLRDAAPALPSATTDGLGTAAADGDGLAAGPAAGAGVRAGGAGAGGGTVGAAVTAGWHALSRRTSPANNTAAGRVCMVGDSKHVAGL